MKKLILAAVAGAVLAAASAAQANTAFDARLAGSAVYSDPAFQDFVETSQGYLNPRYAPQAVPAFRDAVAAPASAAPVKTPAYVFVSILPGTTDYSRLVADLSGTAGFVLKGERTSYTGGSRKTRILGWVKSSLLEAARNTPGVASVRVLKGARPAARL